MDATSILFLSAAILLNAGSSVFYKWSAQSTGRVALVLFLVGIALGGLNAFLYTKSLSRIRLEVAYPTFSAGSIICVSLASVFVFSEAFSIRQGLGIAVVLLGIVLLTSPHV